MTLHLASGELPFSFCVWCYLGSSWHLMSRTSVSVFEVVSFCSILIQQGRNSVFCFPVGGAIAQAYGFPYLSCLQLHLRVGPFYLHHFCRRCGSVPSLLLLVPPGATEAFLLLVSLAVPPSLAPRIPGGRESGWDGHLRGQGCFPSPPVAICSLDNGLRSHSQTARLLFPSSAFPLHSSPPSFKCTDMEDFPPCWCVE